MGIQGQIALLGNLLLALTLWIPAAHGHPSHESFAELEWSEDRTQLEVSLKVIPEDLESALSALAGHPVVLERLPDAHLEEKNFNTALLLDRWLADNFHLINEAGQTTAPQLVGLDLSYKEAWLYFTLQASPRDQLDLHNSVLLAEQPRQVNRVRPLWSTNGETLLFTAQHHRRRLWP